MPQIVQQQQVDLIRVSPSKQAAYVCLVNSQPFVNNASLLAYEDVQYVSPYVCPSFRNLYEKENYSSSETRHLRSEMIFFFLKIYMY